MRNCMFVVSACAVLAVSTASAHGPQIQITVDTANSNKIVTRQVLPGNTYSSTNGLTAPASVYVLPVQPVTFNGQPVARVQPISTQVFGPGFTYGYDQFANPGGSRLFTADLILHLDGLQIWNGSAFVDTGAGMEQLGLRQTSGNTLADTLQTIMGSDADLTIPVAKDVTTLVTNYTADSHSSVRYQLLGDGLSPNVTSRDGVYLVTMQLTGLQTTPSLSDSNTFYYILSKNVAPNDLTAVVNSFAASQGISPSLVQYMGVPEPETAMLLAVSLLGSLALPRTRRRAGKR